MFIDTKQQRDRLPRSPELASFGGETRARALGPLLLAILVSACGGRTAADYGGGETAPDASSALSFPVGTYEDCVQGLGNQDHNLFFNSVGFAPDATLTVTQSEQTVTTAYVDENGETSSFDFAITTNASASLAPGSQLVLGSTGVCVLGIGVSNEKFSPATLNTNAGALTYDSGTVFISLTGVIESETEECGLQSSPSTSWILCREGSSQKPADPPPPAPVPDLPVGDYACLSQIATFYESDGLKQFVASGGEDGTLTLTQAGAEVTAEYSGDSFMAGTIQMSVTTETTANATPNQDLMAPCEVPISIGAPPPPPIPATLPITSGSLAINDSTLVLSFTGKMGASSSCSGAEKAGSLICSKQ